jgi:hypothetical protein
VNSNEVELIVKIWDVVIKGQLLSFKVIYSQ